MNKDPALVLRVVGSEDQHARLLFRPVVTNHPATSRSPRWFRLLAAAPISSPVASRQVRDSHPDYPGRCHSVFKRSGSSSQRA